MRRGYNTRLARVIILRLETALTLVGTLVGARAAPGEQLPRAPLSHSYTYIDIYIYIEVSRYVTRPVHFSLRARGV